MTGWKYVKNSFTISSHSNIIVNDCCICTPNLWSLSNYYKTDKEIILFHKTKTTFYARSIPLKSTDTLVWPVTFQYAIYK